MRTKEEAAWIRAQVETMVGRRGRANPFREDVRRRAVDYFFVRRQQKISPAKIALEIGIGLPTLRSWTLPKKRLAARMVPEGFERIEIAETPAQSANTQVVVRGPGGLCIEGLDIDSLAELIRRLS
jgi:hypothetical protein